MPDVHEALRPFGLWPAPDEGRPALRAQCTVLAQRLREGRARTIGLLPAGGDECVAGLAIVLGRAMARASLSSVGLVDALGSWPCAQALVAAAASDGRPLATSWLADDLAVLTPRTPDLGAALERVRAIVAKDASPFGHLLVDLTGSGRSGHALAACALLDAVVVVARSGRTTTHQVRRWLRDLPEDRIAGVLLTGT